MEIFVFDSIRVDWNLITQRPAVMHVRLYYLDNLVADTRLDKKRPTMPFSVTGEGGNVARGELGVTVQPHEITLWGNIYTRQEHFNGVIAEYPLS